MSSGEEQAEGNHPLWKGLLPLVILSTLSSLDTVVDIYGAIVFIVKSPKSEKMPI